MLNFGGLGFKGVGVGPDVGFGDFFLHTSPSWDWTAYSRSAMSNKRCSGVALLQMNQHGT